MKTVKRLNPYRRDWRASLIGVWVLTWCFFGTNDAWGQAYARSTRQVRRLHEDRATGFTLDVEIDFRDGTTANPNKARVKYTYNGPLLIADRYAVWKMRYVDGYGRPQERQFSTAIGGGEIRGELGNAPANQIRVTDEPFDCKGITSLCYDIGIANTPLWGTVGVVENPAPMPVNRAAQPAVEINAADFGGSLLSLGIGAAYISRSALDYAEPRKAPLVFAAYDKRLPVIVGPGEIWAGLAVSYNAYSSGKRHDVRFVPRVSYVCQLTSDVQVYGALGAGWRHSFGYPLIRSALYPAPVAGVRYSLRPRLGLFAEAGYDATVLKFGVCFQPRQQRPPNEWLHTAKDGSLQKKEFALSAGIGVGQFAVPDIEFSPVSYRRSPLFLASLDQGLVNVGRTGMISFGLTVAFRTTRFDSMVGNISYDEFFTTGRIAYNAPLFQRLNTYAGVAAGGKMSASSAATTTGIEPVTGLFVGLRYALIDRSGVSCEAGTDAALLRLGIFYFLHC